jgi:hypothetical protein
VDGVTQAVSQDMIDLIYGGITSASSISADAAKCLSSISKASQKLSGTIVKGVSKCRSCITKTPDKCPFNPDTCQDDDAKLAGKIAKSQQKLADTLTKKCTDGHIVELDLCGQGQGAVTTIADATDCLIDAIGEVSDTSAPAAQRQFAGRNIIDAAYPAGPICGDDVVNQLPNISQHIGEECDGSDDAACPGLCLPPGDPFQCTCSAGGLIPNRVRFLADGATADLDNGWTGASHNNGVTQNAGFTTEYTDCDCDDMDGNTCVGSSGDPICNAAGRQQPTCSWDPLGATRCDDHGGDTGGGSGPGGDGFDEDADCAICDSFALNAGAFCEGSADCDGQCYDAGGTPTGLCPNGQSDCGAGEICRGSCDMAQQCIVLTNGAPLPISSEGTAVCVLTQFRENIFGSMNLATGEHETFIQQFSVVHFEAGNPTRPCPTCGGFCVGGSATTEDTPCTGTCSVSTEERCRFDTDCPSGEVCSENSPDCTFGGVCNLSLVCSPGTANEGEPCRVDAQTSFGTTSNDCPPDSFKNISGQGLEINFFPQTSEISTLSNPSVPPGTPPPGYDCTAPGFENFRCACPDNGGQPTRPNRCAFTCDTGAEFGIGCGIATDGAGFATKCTDTGKACDEDHDCPAGTCSANPSHCINVADFQKSCTTDADCDGSLDSCADACPTGRCTQVCVGGEDGDVEEGFCIGGPQPFLCTGKPALACTQPDSEASCSSTCSTSMTPCGGIADCPNGETCEGTCARSAPCESGSDGIFGTDDDIPFAGTCAASASRCFTHPVAGEGGDIFNQRCVNTGFQDTPCTSDADCGGVPGGCYLNDSTNVRTNSTFCIGGTTSDAINGTAGLPGPGRLRQRGINATNGFTALP